jgi:signal transduction histidine kinase
MTLRLRLTLLYGGCFLIAGAALLGITYGLVRGHVLGTSQVAIAVRPQPSGRVISRADVTPGTKVFFKQVATGGAVPKQLPAGVPAGFINTAKRLQEEARLGIANVQTTAVNSLLVESGIALAIMAVVSIGLGWLMAGRALRPLVTMNARARQITEHNLHQRLGIDARDDELGELAATFDGVLGRLQRAFEAQRRFVANASHELRTPITLERALVEVALADPDSDVESLRTCCERVLAAGEQQERLIEALLTLARSQAGLESRRPVDLAAVAGQALEQRAPGPVEFGSTLGTADVPGDSALLERLVANLLDNAAAYNVATGGWVRVSTAAHDGEAVLRVENSGPQVPSDRVGELFEPFRRLDGDRINGRRGLGLGLSIVSAIATAHHGRVDATPRADGGLDVIVRLPVH